MWVPDSYKPMSQQVLFAYLLEKKVTLSRFWPNMTRRASSLESRDSTYFPLFVWSCVTYYSVADQIRSGSIVPRASIIIMIRNTPLLPNFPFLERRWDRCLWEKKRSHQCPNYRKPTSSDLVLSVKNRGSFLSLRRSLELLLMASNWVQNRVWNQVISGFQRISHRLFWRDASSNWYWL